MQQNPEIYIVTIIGIVLGAVLVIFIITMLLLYQQRQKKQEMEVQKLKDAHEKESLRTQLEIQENTMKTISQELHDNIGQMLSVVKISLSVLPLAKEHPAYQPSLAAQEVLNKAIFDLSNLTKSLHTDRISQVGLVESVRFELEAIKNAGIIQVDFRQEGPEINLDEQKSLFVFRIFQEILNNILKHAKAGRVDVIMSYLDDNFTLEVHDNGMGFDVAAKRNSAEAAAGVGLKSIFNRAEIIGATLDVESNRTGTYFKIQLPLFGD